MEIKYSPDCIKQESYIKEISKLIEISRKLDSSVIPHSEDELIYRYAQSLLCVKEDKIIGHMSLYRTEISEILSLNIGEMGSVIVDPNFRGKNIGGLIIKEGIKKLGNNFDGVVAATINPIMLKKLRENNFIRTDFPSSCLEGGKKYLSPLMKGGEEEFYSRAAFSVKENVIGIRDKIIGLI